MTGMKIDASVHIDPLSFDMHVLLDDMVYSGSSREHMCPKTTTLFTGELHSSHWLSSDCVNAIAPALKAMLAIWVLTDGTKLLLWMRLTTEKTESSP